MPSGFSSLLYLFGSKYFYKEIIRLDHVIKKTIIREMSRTFTGEEDVHHGITVSSAKEPCRNINEFKTILEGSLEKWIASNRRAIWFKVNVNEAEWIPVLAENGFRIHHGIDDVVTMVRWLPKDEINHVPPYAHNMVGAGAIVLTDDDKILVVKERYKQISFWKLPGGYVESKEGIADAAIREVLEETSIKTEFEGLVSFRHSFHAPFGCSDLYFIVNLKPLNLDIVKQTDEVEEVTWMTVTEFLNHPEVYELNKMLVKHCLQLRRQGTKISKTVSSHPITGASQDVYIVTPLSDV